MQRNGNYYQTVSAYGSDTNLEVRRRSAQPPVTQAIKARRLRLFGLVARSDPMQDRTMHGLRDTSRRP